MTEFKPMTMRMMNIVNMIMVLTESNNDGFKDDMNDLREYDVSCTV